MVLVMKMCIIAKDINRLSVIPARIKLCNRRTTLANTLIYFAAGTRTAHARACLRMRRKSFFGGFDRTPRTPLGYGPVNTLCSFQKQLLSVGLSLYISVMMNHRIHSMHRYVDMDSPEYKKDECRSSITAAQNLLS